MTNDIDTIFTAKKQYHSARVEITSIIGSTILYPASPPLEPAPERHWRPGPGASYDPKGSIL